MNADIHDRWRMIGLIEETPATFVGRRKWVSCHEVAYGNTGTLATHILSRPITYPRDHRAQGLVEDPLQRDIMTDWLMGDISR